MAGAAAAGGWLGGAGEGVVDFASFDMSADADAESSAGFG
jgi:hypothetical protein